MEDIAGMFGAPFSGLYKKAAMDPPELLESGDPLF
jgi:hypothetical protein